jgi:GAF domain-containing protein
MVIEAIYRGLGCRQVVLALRDATGTRLQGRMALGGDERLSVAARAQCVQVPLAASDALAQACRAGEDLWIERLAGSRGPWPQWLREEARPASFVALPLCLRGRPVAVVYADHGQPSTWSEPERALVGALRSQALLALRAAGASPSS